MSLNFKLKYDQMRESDPTKEELRSGSESKQVEEYYPNESHARNICFVWQDGRRIFLNYSYLVSGEYLPDESLIKLAFTSQALILKGVNLEGLFYDIMQHWVRQIVCVNARYNIIGEGEKPVVNEIIVKSPDKL